MIGLAGIGITLAIFFATQTRAALELQLTSSVPLAAPTRSMSDRVQVLLDGEEVEQLWLSSFRLINTGNIDIGPGDFAKPIQLVTTRSSLRDVIPGDADPDDLSFKLSTKSESVVELDPMLLKPGEYLAFSLLSTSRLDDLSASSRIKGVDKITLKSSLESADTDGSSLLPALFSTAISALVAGVSIAAFGSSTFTG